MPRIPRPHLNKIPGDYMPIAEQEVHAKDLKILTHLELKDLKVRQEKLLFNKKQLQTLPDKGKRIKKLYENILDELERRTNVEEAAKLFSNLNIASTGERKLNNLEWDGNLCDKSDVALDALDSDDEYDIDPLRILAQRQMHQRQIKRVEPEPSLITEDDLKDIELFKLESADSGIQTETERSISPINVEIINIDVKTKLETLKMKLSHKKIENKETNNNHRIDREKNNSQSSEYCPNVDGHVNYLIEKTELNIPEKREKFKPYQTTVTNVHDPAKEKMRKKTKHWEITAATPPPIQHNPTKMISLMESVEIQEQYIKKLKELQEKQAAERLLAKQQRMEHFKINIPQEEILKTQASFINYRSISQLDKLLLFSNNDKQNINEKDLEHNDDLDTDHLSLDSERLKITKDIID